jgi:hypothetical protein
LHQVPAFSYNPSGKPGPVVFLNGPLFWLCLAYHYLIEDYNLVSDNFVPCSVFGRVFPLPKTKWQLDACLTSFPDVPCLSHLSTRDYKVTVSGKQSTPKFYLASDTRQTRGYLNEKRKRTLWELCTNASHCHVHKSYREIILKFMCFWTPPFQC